MAAPTAALLVDVKVAWLDDLKADMMVDDSVGQKVVWLGDWFD